LLAAIQYSFFVWRQYPIMLIELFSSWWNKVGMIKFYGFCFFFWKFRLKSVTVCFSSENLIMQKSVKSFSLTVITNSGWIRRSKFSAAITVGELKYETQVSWCKELNGPRWRIRRFHRNFVWDKSTILRIIWLFADQSLSI